MCILIVDWELLFITANPKCTGKDYAMEGQWMVWQSILHQLSGWYSFRLLVFSTWYWRGTKSDDVIIFLLNTWGHKHLFSDRPFLHESGAYKSLSTASHRPEGCSFSVKKQAERCWDRSNAIERCCGERRAFCYTNTIAEENQLSIPEQESLTAFLIQWA